MQRTKKLEENNKGTKQRKENQNVVVVANPTGSSSLYCQTAIAPLSHRYRYAVALLSLRCRTAIAPLSFHCRYAAVALLLLCCCAAVTPLLHRYRSASVATAVATQSHCYRTGIAPLLLRCCHSCCRYTVAPLSHRCCAVVEPRSFRTREGINNSILNCYCSTVTPLSLLLLIGRFTRLSPQEA